MGILNLRLIILLITILVNGFLAVVVNKSGNKATNKIFGGLSFITICWLVDVYLSVTPAFIGMSLLWVRLSIFFAAIQIMFFYLLADTIPYDKLQMKPRNFRLFIILTTVVMLDGISPFAFTKVIVEHNSVQAVPGVGLPLFVLYALVFSVGSIAVLIKKLLHATGSEKEQYRYILFGLAAILGLLIGTVLIPVALFKNSYFVPFVPLYTIVFLGMTTIAIIKHKLFDIRTVIARLTAYLLMVSVFVAIYTAAAFAVSFLLFNDGHLNVRRHVTYISLALIFTPTIYWLKKKFDQVTNRLFFQDLYDPQSVLDDLSNVLVGNIQLNRLLTQSSQVIKSSLKLTSCTFVLVKDDLKDLDLSNVVQQSDFFRHLLHNPSLKGTTIITENIAQTYIKLAEDLRSNNVAALVRLSTHTERIGYMVLGEKLSGNSYKQKDAALLEIMSNELALAIQNSLRFEEIEQFNVTLQQKVNIATKQLQKSNDKLKALDETKDEFISMASHQLRTPLTSVKGYVSMVLEGDAGKISAEQKKLLNQAFISSQRMVYLIADLLNVSRLRTGKFVIETKPTNLADVIEGEISQLTLSAKARKLTLTYEKPKSFPMLNLDETKIRQVIMNFIDNAIYYTPAGGHITVALKDNDSSVEYTVTDDGIGIPVSDQHHLFTKFFRAGNARKARPDGTGLGLFMAKKVIVAQGGALVFKSEEGKGSTFGFSFAKQKHQAGSPKTPVIAKTEQK